MQTTTAVQSPIVSDDVFHATTQADARPLDETTGATIRRHYPAAAFRGPLFEARDRIALVMATVMLIGPLVALPLGF